MLIRRLFCAAGASAALLAPWAALSQTSPPAASPAAALVPAEAFFQNYATGGAVLAPNGRLAALRTPGKNGRMQLVVVDPDKRTAKTIVAFDNVDVASFGWVNDKRLVFTVGDRELAMGDRFGGPGLFAVDPDGADIRPIIDVAGGPVGGPGRPKFDFQARFAFTTRSQASDDVFVYVPRYGADNYLEAVNLVRVDTRTGATHTYQRPGRSTHWLIDARDQPRVTVTREGRTAAVWWAESEGNWTKLAEYDAIDRRNAIEPFAIGPDSTLYVRAELGGKTAAIYRFDREKKKVDPEPLLTEKGFDFTGSLLDDGQRLLGVRHLGDAEGTVWFDEDLKKVQARIDTLRPGTINNVFPALRSQTPYVAVYSYSDAEPGTALLFNRDSGQFTVLAKALPGIDPARMARRDMIRYKARDGREIPAWLTLPRDAKGRKVPLVMLVHDGPWLRGGSWNWRADSQFLASRGYAVLEPEYRGSAGFGFDHFQAGWKQWGLAMQNDVADGVRWAAAQGTVDPDRVCIAGSGYGGYSVLMGLVNDPTLFRCGVSFGPVTDIDLMYDIFWNEVLPDYRLLGMPVLIGDRTKDAAQLKATSPLQQASRITQPLLLAHGAQDKVIPIEHSIKLRDAVQKTNPQVEWVQYADEKRGLSLVKNRVDFWTRVEKFLACNIGAATH